MTARRAVSLTLLTLLILVPGLTAREHPALDDSAHCVDCHAGKVTGPAVHAPVLAGCDSCHQVQRQGETTVVLLVRPPSDLCFGCHKERTYAYRHFPYYGGMCTRCHDPHGQNPRRLRASVNELCLGCHLANGAQVRPGQPMIRLDASKSMGHPIERHPVTGKRDPVRDKDLDCTSCHMAHGSSKRHLIRIGVEIPGDVLNKTVEGSDICSACHQVLQTGVAEKSAHNGKRGKRHH